MNTNDFTKAARAEAESWIGMNPDDHDNFVSGAEWARTHLAAQEPTDAEVEAAARELAERESPTYGAREWDETPPHFPRKQEWRLAARAALSAARAARQNEEKR